MGRGGITPMTGGLQWTHTGSLEKTGREEKQGVYLLYEGAAQIYGNRRRAGWEFVGDDQRTSQ